MYIPVIAIKDIGAKHKFVLSVENGELTLTAKEWKMYFLFISLRSDIFNKSKL